MQKVAHLHAVSFGFAEPYSSVFRVKNTALYEFAVKMPNRAHQIFRSDEAECSEALLKVR